MSKIVVALGGNALGNNVIEQIENSKIAAISIVDIVEGGHKVVVAHGNGPQVGIISKNMNENGVEMPLVECTAMSQGYIGYHLAQCIRNELKARGLTKEVCTILTQVVVDNSDPAFDNPTKPIGSYYDETEALALMQETGKKYVEDSNRGWRLVVPSPRPIDICEKNVIRTMVELGAITIACGGGGMPVVLKGDSIYGIDAVIDKDFAAAKLAELIEADFLFILTAVDQVKINFNKPNEQALTKITISETRQYISEGHFAPGSMLPKIEAALSFVQIAYGKKAIIGSLFKANEALLGRSGTTLISD